MADIEIEIDDLTPGVLQATSVLHSKDTSGDDIQGTVQQVLDLVPSVDVDGFVYEVGNTVTPGSDYVVFTDASDSGQVKRAPFLTFKSALNVLSPSGSVTSGYYNLGDLQLRWGTVTSDSDFAQNFTFAVPFTTACDGVFISRGETGGNFVMYAINRSTTGFAIDRNDEIQGIFDVQYFAIGR